MARFEVHPEGIRDLQRGDVGRRLVQNIAEHVEVQIASRHPRGRGNVVRSLGRESELTVDGWVVHVGYLRSKHRSASFGHLVEFGSVNNPPYAPIRSGVQAAGLRLEGMF